MGAGSDAGVVTGKWTMFLAPLADHYGSDTVTDEVGKGPGFRHETVDAENEHQTPDWDMGYRREGRSQNNEAAPCDACRALGSKQQPPEQGKLVGKLERSVGRLRPS